MKFLLKARMSKLNQTTQALFWNETYIYFFFFTKTSEYIVSDIHGNIIQTGGTEI